MVLFIISIVMLYLIISGRLAGSLKGEHTWWEPKIHGASQLSVTVCQSQNVVSLSLLGGLGILRQIGIYWPVVQRWPWPAAIAVLLSRLVKSSGILSRCKFEEQHSKTAREEFRHRKTQASLFLLEDKTGATKTLHHSMLHRSELKLR